ncbi:MAG: SLC13 family permease [Nanoarchaeota archaeon]
MWPWIKVIAAGLFIIAYIFFIFRYDKKHITVWSVVLVSLLLGVISPLEGWRAINWNVIGIFIGMFVLSDLFIQSRMPDLIAHYFANRSKNSAVAILWMCTISGFISIFVENVATVLIVAPVAFTIAKKLKVSPIPFILGVAVCSNLQGVATLVGDPPSMIMGAFAKLTFNDFFFYQGKPGLFFAVQLGAIAGLAMLWFLFRKNKAPVPKFDDVKVKSYIPTILMVGMIVLLAIAGFLGLPESIRENSAGIVCMAMAFIGAIWYISTQEGTAVKLSHKLIKSVDWETTAFLIGIFILVQTLSTQGIVNDIADLVSVLAKDGIIWAYLVVVVSAVIFSAFVDNVPFTAAMLPVAALAAQSIGAPPHLLYFGLLIGASVGGNITPIGASANIVAMGMLKKEGHNPGFWGFVKIGLPYTIIAVIVSAGFVWFMFGG